MKAVTQERYGTADVLEIKDVATPTPGPDEVLVKIGASGITTGDWRMRASAFPGIFWLPGRLMAGLFRPRHRIPGSDFSGTIVAAGSNVTRFREGDHVFGTVGHGANAEYMTVPQDGAIAIRPQGLADTKAAALPFGALSALSFLRDFGRVNDGDRVLIIGASGGVGTYAVQIARHFGARVTGVSSASNADLVRRLGAEHTIDYATEDSLSGGPYDIILDTIGVTDFGKARPALADGGRLVVLNGKLREIVQTFMTRNRHKKLVFGISMPTGRDVEELRDLVEAGAVYPVIDRVYPLDEIREAHRQVEGRHRSGAIVLDHSISESQITEKD